jgi:hypothetical protein
VDQARWQFQATAMEVPPAGGWPILTDTFPALDTTKTVVLPGDSAVYFRTEALVGFDYTLSDSAKAAILAGANASVLGVTPAGTFWIRFPDPVSDVGFRAYLDALAATTGVRAVSFILRSSPKVQVFGRYPSDATGQLRSDWVNGTSTTWAFRAIRAPLAWGCETGAYGGTPVRVGVLEWKHDLSHPEFSTSSPVSWEPSDIQLARFSQPVPQAKADSLKEHGTGVTGILSARGDNGSGLAGVMWQTRLHLYSGMSPGHRATDLQSGFYQIVTQIGRDSIRILTISMDQQVSKAKTAAERARDIEGVAGDLRHLLQANPRLLIIVAAGNERFQGSFSQYEVVDTASLVRAALLKVKGEGTYANRILVVAGSQQGNAYWSSYYLNPAAGSNFFTGLTEIAAPAQDYALLALRTGSSVPVTAADRAGTSFAAPMVAGVAAQLMTMDSTLTAAEVKDYILRGAQEPLLDSLTGLPVQRQPVSGAPGTVYQLDAYGSLSLLSRERQHLPACGFPVALHGTLTSQPWVVFTRNGANADSFQLTGFNPDLKFSIAQGGRRLAAPSMDSAGQFVTHEFVRSGPSWTQVNSVPGVRSRTYLEEDTVDALQDERTWVLRGSRWGGSGTTINFPALVNPSDPNTGVGFVRFSPEGSFAVVRASGAPCSNQFARDEAFLVAIPSGTVTPLLNLQCSAGDNERYAMDVTWHPDANRFVLAERNDALIQSILYPRKVSGSGVIPDGNDVLIADRLIIDQFSGPDAHLSEPSGAIAVWKEYTLNGVGGCHLTSRTFRGGVFVSQVSLPFSDPVWGLNCQVPVPTLRHTSGIRPAATRRGP